VILYLRRMKERKKDKLPQAWGEARERVLFIGTQFSILYTSMYSPAEAATQKT
jgi:hypothetical protein